MDISRNRRSHYENGKPTSLDKYKDDELFIHPMAKMLLQIPRDPKDQLLDPILSKEEIAKLPYYDPGYLKYGVTFITDIEKLISKDIYSPIESIPGLWVKHNLIEIPDDILTIEMKTADEASIICTIKDESGKYVEGYTHYYNEKDRTICQISYPDQSIYTVGIFAKNDHLEQKWTQIYKFKIKGKKTAGVTLPLSNSLYKTKQFNDYDIKVISQNIDNTDR